MQMEEYVVTVPIAIVGSTPHCNNEVVEHVLVALHCELVCPGKKLDVVITCKRPNSISTKEETSSSRRKAPTTYF